jgi:regulation of enolase protein 1 (concanavalin A-like superfamily)
MSDSQFRVVLLSPADYNRCVVDIETQTDLLVRLTREDPEQAVQVEFLHEGEDRVRVCLPLQQFLSLLDAAALKLG